MNRIRVVGFTLAALLAGAAVARAYDVTSLPGDDATAVVAAPLRTEPEAGGGELVVTLQPGERVKVWAFTYITERTRTPDGRGGFDVAEEYAMWYRVRTAAGEEGWVAAGALNYPTVPPD